MLREKRYFYFIGLLGVSLLASGCGIKTSTTQITQPIPTPPVLLSTITKEPMPVIPHATSTKPISSSFEQPVVLSGHTDAVTLMSWSPDGTLLASSSGDFSSQDDTIRIWRSDGTLAAILRGHTQSVTGLSWSPDGKTLASSSLDETIRLWRPDGTPMQILEGHAGHVFAVAWSPDGKVLASGSIVTYLNPTVQLWNRDGKIIQTLTTAFSGGKFYNLAWSPDGRFLLGGATDYKLWRADGTEVFWLKRFAASTPAWGMAWSPNSQTWATGDESGNLRIYTIQGEPVAEVQEQGGLNSLAWSPDGRSIAGAKTLWNADGSVRRTLDGQPEYVNSVAWSPNGRILASGGSDGLVHLFTGDGESAGALSGQSGAVRAVAWSPDGKTLASGSEDKTIRLWKLR